MDTIPRGQKPCQSESSELLFTQYLVLIIPTSLGGLQHIERLSSPYPEKVCPSLTYPFRICERKEKRS
ncbi:hypothetical protein TNCV_2782951 [Trichonephila clavipes]|nr:hypothetical protein TNCV_2782951 [Trichonephila clavipes]